MADERFDYLESWCVPCPQGFKKIGGQRQAFAQWFFPLHATIETDGAVSPETVEAKLARPEVLQTRSHRGRRTAAISSPALTRCSPSGSAPALGSSRIRGWNAFCPGTPRPCTSGRCFRTCRPKPWWADTSCSGRVAATSRTVPLFMRPETEFLMGFGILPAIPKQLFEGSSAPTQHGQPGFHHDGRASAISPAGSPSIMRMESSLRPEMGNGRGDEKEIRPEGRAESRICEVRVNREGNCGKQNW